MSVGLYNVLTVCRPNTCSTNGIHAYSHDCCCAVGPDLYGASCVTRTDLTACAGDDAHCEGMVQPKWVANGKHFLADQQTSGVSKLSWVQ